MSVENTREVMQRYFRAEHGDVSTLADDVLFTIMGTGKQQNGPAEVLEMLTGLYHEAFDARVDARNTFYSDSHAVMEGYFIGKHTGEFMGIARTNREVRVPLCVVYDVEGLMIVRARVYFETDTLREQLSGRSYVKLDPSWRNDE